MSIDLKGVKTIGDASLINVLVPHGDGKSWNFGWKLIFMQLNGPEMSLNKWQFEYGPVMKYGHVMYEIKLLLMCM